MSVAKFNSVEIPQVKAQVVDREFIGDRVRLAGGQMHQDKVAIKRTWTLDAEYLLKSTADNIISELESSNWKVDFWLDEFGVESNTVVCYVDIEKEERVGFGARDTGTWQSDGRKMSFKIIEQ